MMHKTKVNYIDLALSPNRVLNHIDIIETKARLLAMPSTNQCRQLCRAGHIELQLTDKCCLECSLCHFRNQGGNELSFEWLDKIVKYIRPRAITLAGGGEPTMFPRFNDAIFKLATIPDVKMGLITNGVTVPTGKWPELLSWVRISLYSLHDGFYAGRPTFIRDAVLKNIAWYLRNTSIQNVGVHFLFYQQNVEECVQVAKVIFSIFRDDDYLDRIHLQFKPAFMTARPSSLTDLLHSENLSLIPTHIQVKAVLNEFRREALQDQEFGHFLKNRTNYHLFQKLAEGALKDLVNITKPGRRTLRGLDRCHVCLAYLLISPAGMIYPCLTLAEHRLAQFSVCHVSEIEQQIGNSLMRYHQAGTECCNQTFCRSWSQNQIIETHLSGQVLGYIPEDMFF